MSSETPAARTARGASGVFRSLLPYARAERGTLVLAGVITLVLIAVDLLVPWPVKVVVDQVILEQPWSLLPDYLAGPDNRLRLLWVSAGSVIFLAAAGGFLEYSRVVLLARAGNEVVARMRQDLHRHLLRLSLWYHDRQRRGDLLVRLTGDASMMKTFMIEGALQLGQEALTLVGVAAIMLVIDWRLTIVAIVVVPGVVMITTFFGRRLRRAASRQRKKEGEIATTAAEALAAIPVIQAYGLEKAAAEQFRKKNKKSKKAGLAAARIEGAMSRWTQMTTAVGTALMLMLGGRLVLNGSLSAGDLIVLLAYVRTLYRPLRRISTRAAKMLKASAAGERIIDVLAEPLDVKSAENPIQVAEPRGDVRFSRVTYEYVPGTPVLRDVSLHIRPGEHVALMGPNGSGKSTLASLLPRLRDVTTGRVLVDGEDVTAYDLDTLRSRVGILFQSSVLFDGTILENVQLAAPDADEETVRTALRASGLATLADRLPQGLETPVGEFGGGLSGGQRQRIALAQVLVRKAPIVILDEPTNSLDEESSNLLGSDLFASLRGSTVLVITHDLDLAARMDRGVVLRDGELLFDGDAKEATELLRALESMPPADNPDPAEEAVP